MLYAMLAIVVAWRLGEGQQDQIERKREPTWIKKIVRGRSIYHHCVEYLDMKYTCIFSYLDPAIGKILTEVKSNFLFNVNTMGIDGMATHEARVSTPLVLT